jgi:3-hydroxyacyl-CoA dehydrogenase
MINIRDGIAVIDLNTPPLNCLDHALRTRIVRLVEAATSHAQVKGIVLAGSDRAFSAGADLMEFETPMRTSEPVLDTVLACIEASRKPVVAAISGLAVGGGLELALACHGRVAVGTAVVGLPEVLLGLIPGAGGTQRLPRLIGIEAALNMVESGESVRASELANSGMFDRVVNQRVIEAAIEHALALAARPGALPRARDVSLDAASVRSAVAARREKFMACEKLQPVFSAILEAFAACALPFEAGLKVEGEIFARLAQTRAAHALRYLFKAEREARKIPSELRAKAQPIRTVAVTGSAAHGREIVVAALDAGFDVLLLNEDAAALRCTHQRVVDTYRQAVTAGLQDDIAAARQARLTPSRDWGYLVNADFVVEVVSGDVALRHAVFRKIDKHARPGAILATTTSSIDGDRIAAAIRCPSQLIGLRFHSPGETRKLLEIVHAKGSSPEAIATAIAFGIALKKIPVLTADSSAGLVADRIHRAVRNQYELMIEDGARADELDGALADLGLSVEPVKRAARSGPHPQPPLLGREQIQRRALLSMVNEAACLLAERVVGRGSDIDVILVHGHGFPRSEGGPVFWARQQDRAALEADLRRIEPRAGNTMAQTNLAALLT